MLDLVLEDIWHVGFFDRGKFDNINMTVNRTNRIGFCWKIFLGLF